VPHSKHIARRTTRPSASVNLKNVHGKPQGHSVDGAGSGAGRGPYPIAIGHS
jgi:hypothetical protein